MLNSVIVFVAKLALGKQLLSLVDGINERLTGHRSELIILAIALVSLLGHVGLLDKPTADGVCSALATALPVTLAEKVGHVLDEAGKILPAPKPGQSPPSQP